MNAASGDRGHCLFNADTSVKKCLIIASDLIFNIYTIDWFVECHLIRTCEFGMGFKGEGCIDWCKN